ncbi:hypothetical protein D3C81_1306330 [compost metagenome]
MKNGGKYGFEDVPHPLGAKAVKGPKVGSLPTGQPHEGDVLPDGFRDLSRGIDALGVSVDDDLGQHFRVVTVTATAGIGGVKDRVIQPIYG